MSDLEQLHVIFHGRVQGVGFRATCARYAQLRGLQGTVQNLPDGSVELHALGKRELLDALLNDLQKDPGPSSITLAETSFAPASRAFVGFQVLR